MSKYRTRLPQLKDQLFITDGGLETTLIYQDRIDLPAFAAFDLLKDDPGLAVLRRYFVRYTELARSHHVGLVLESPTWRANSDWGTRLGYDATTLADANRKGIGLLLEIRAEHENAETRMVVSGNLGPRGDGYKPGSRMSAFEAQSYHTPQIRTFEQTDADMISAFTMNYVEEGIGIAAAAKSCEIPVAISFTLETNGKLPSGDTLEHAIARTDDATDGYPAYYMINCAHPTHFDKVLDGGWWLNRIRGLRANASKRSHAELDESSDLDAGDPEELGEQYRILQSKLPKLSVVGGCCGTDHRHVNAICTALQEERG